MYHCFYKDRGRDYGDCLKMLMTDIEEEKKYKGTAWIQRGLHCKQGTYKSDRPVVYLDLDRNAMIRMQKRSIRREKSYVLPMDCVPLHRQTGQKGWKKDRYGLPLYSGSKPV